MPHLELRPLTLRAASAQIERLHRHHDPTVGWLWGTSAWMGGRLVGVAVAGRPEAKELQDGRTLEVRRVATDGTHNACSILYAACWRAGRALGYLRACTYIQEGEPGTSLLAAGWVRGPYVPPRSWDRRKRRRQDKHEIVGRWRYQVGAWS